MDRESILRDLLNSDNREVLSAFDDGVNIDAQLDGIIGAPYSGSFDTEDVFCEGDGYSLAESDDCALHCDNTENNQNISSVTQEIHSCLPENIRSSDISILSRDREEFLQEYLVSGNNEVLNAFDDGVNLDAQLESIAGTFGYNFIDFRDSESATLDSDEDCSVICANSGLENENTETIEVMEETLFDYDEVINNLRENNILTDGDMQHVFSCVDSANINEHSDSESESEATSDSDVNCVSDSVYTDCDHEDVTADCASYDEVIEELVRDNVITINDMDALFSLLNSNSTNTENERSHSESSYDELINPLFEENLINDEDINLLNEAIGIIEKPLSNDNITSDEDDFTESNQDNNNDPQAQVGSGNLLQFEKISESEGQNLHFKKHEFTSTFRVKHNLRRRSDLLDAEKEIDSFFTMLIKPYLENEEYRARNDLITIEINEPSMRSSIYIPPFRINSFRVKDFLSTLMKLSQSNTVYLLSGHFTVKVRVVENVVGGALQKRKYPKEKNNSTKRSIIQIVTERNNDGSCGFRALFVEKFLADHTNSHREWRAVVNDYNRKQTIGAQNVAALCGFDWCHRIELGDMEIIQQKLPEYQIRLIDDEYGSDILFAGPVSAKQINILYSCRDGGHYNVCSSLKAYFNSKNFCNFCNRGFDKKFRHKCEYTCEACFQQPRCDRQNTEITCETCKRSFYGDECYRNHEVSICENKQRCESCDTEYCGRHECNKWFCKRCNLEYNTFPHYCFLMPLLKEKIEEEDSQYRVTVAYDIETIQKTDQFGKTTHHAYLICCIVVCNECYNYETKEKNSDNCEKCGRGNISWWGYNCIKKFTDYIYKDLAVNAFNNGGNVILFAHNARGFDGHYILKDMFHRNFEQKAKIIMTGNKILKLEIGNCRFIDSLSYFQMPLDAIPKAFGLQTHKSFFPIDMLREEYIDYNGELPSLEFYGLKWMGKQKAAECARFHEQELARLQENNLTWNLKENEEVYCHLDCKVLIQGVKEFEHLMKDITKIDPYTRSFTLASLAMEVFRANYLKEHEIGITPVHGYRSGRNPSKAGTAWLLAIEELHRRENPSFKIHKEQKVGKYFVDGAHHESNTIFEFYGCYYHGCPVCYKDKMDELSVNEETHEYNLLKTIEREEYFLNNGVNIVAIWQCEIAEILRGESILKDEIIYYYRRLCELEKYGDVDIEVRGGRCENIYFYKKAAVNEEIKYYDFTSLYPYVCASKPLPLKHPEIFYPRDTDITNYYGFIKCSILPPRQLNIPVLPYKCDQKLLFPLCRTCAETRYSGSCNHSDDERKLIGTWYSRELRYALLKGYKIEKVFAVNHYANKSETLFEEYVNKFSKIKMESSGVPPKYNGDKEKYARKIRKKSNCKILLDLVKICVNAGLRTLAKLLLNTIWGKFAQKLIQANSKICREYRDYWKILNDPTKKILGEVEIDERTMFVKYKERYPDEKKARKTNHALAAAVTGNARIELYHMIDKLETARSGRVMYMDTDSIFFSQIGAEWQPKTGDYLGEMTDEVEKDYGLGAKITEFVSNGPKNYGYIVKLADGTQKCVLKVKGIRFNSEAAERLTFERMKRIAEAYVNGEEITIQLPQFNITSDLAQNVYSNVFDKNYRAVTDKRRIIPDTMSTKPLGFVDQIPVTWEYHASGGRTVTFENENGERFTEFQPDSQ